MSGRLRHCGVVVFFFSSRRRHTRFDCDWSSDVCSSDLARAEKLDVPIYFHPGLPKAEVIEAYYKEYAADYPILLRAAWGYTVETANQAEIGRASCRERG